eukprot:CAMPEP_0174847634 /NCGR_PEP_ID=MMETSP1114-20130205/13032_1 /TAXON_ID=312471 /ORGANISM="Neobodo designis, Strain CCAP 1951/1" /LENGTH=73 /DNA_ID=CAMNT_0016081915 /DNA_START=299 /DNA_END=520 /DNA_ORIENTATION=+
MSAPSATAQTGTSRTPDARDLTCLATVALVATKHASGRPSSSFTGSPSLAGSAVAGGMRDDCDLLLREPTRFE